jgi:hypothetical protein
MQFNLCVQVDRHSPAPANTQQLNALHKTQQGCNLFSCSLLRPDRKVAQLQLK